jgi:steroid 5-alpha reductase family enzyme
MMGSDYQKTMTLSKKKGKINVIIGLISTGFFARTRNPNYLG